MVMGGRSPDDAAKSAFGIDRVLLRLAVFGTLVVALFVALFSRLWFLQVLAAPDFRQAAKDNRIRIVQSEPPRGRILDRNAKVLVNNRLSRSVTVDPQVVDSKREKRKILGRLSMLLDIPVGALRENLQDEAVSPYKPVPVAGDVRGKDAKLIGEYQNRFPGVAVDTLPVRRYPQGRFAAQILGYVNEITPEQLGSDRFKRAKPRYQPGDIVGQLGIEYTYDHLIRGRPSEEKVVVNSANEVVGSRVRQEERPGDDLYLTIDSGIQRITEKALEDGILAARSLYQAPAGGAVVLDPNNGEVLAMASFPTYNPSILTDKDGFSPKDSAFLGNATPEDNTDDKLINRTVQGAFPPGSTFKVVTAGAAMWTGVATPYSYLPCPPVRVYPPEGGPGSVAYNNWTSADLGGMGMAESLEVSCDTFYYELGWQMEAAFGKGLATGDGTERFQKYMRMAGFGHETGIDLPYETDGLVADEAWCQANKDIGYCPPAGHWLPGYTVNMAIGQGELIVTPMQMAVTFAAIANGGRVVEPHLAKEIRSSDSEVVKEFEPKTVRRLPLDAAELAPLQTGLVDVISGDQGTATSAFAGFPTGRYPIAGKTGTAQIGSVTSGLNYAWFISYAPADDPQYVVAVYLEKAGHGGESAAPVARQIYEGIFDIDKRADVQLGQDDSG